MCLALEYLLPRPLGNMIGFGNMSLHENEFVIQMAETIALQANKIDFLQSRLLQFKTIDSSSTQHPTVAIMEKEEEEDHTMEDLFNGRYQ